MQAETPYPKIDQSKRTAACDDDGAFLASTDAMITEGGYLASANLSAMCGAVAFGPAKTPGTPCLKGRLMWKLVGKTVHAKVAVNGAFGWLAIGLRNPGGAHNGMNGGRVVLALPGSPISYTASTGLDLSSGPSVNEYVIIEVGGPAFRFWKTLHAQPSVTAASFEAADCHTSMAFSTPPSAPSLNVTGSDELIWGMNDADAFVGYHGSDHRGILTANWADGLQGAPAHSHSMVNVAGGVAGIAVGAACRRCHGCARHHRRLRGEQQGQEAADVEGVEIKMEAQAATTPRRGGRSKGRAAGDRPVATLPSPPSLPKAGVRCTLPDKHVPDGISQHAHAARAVSHASSDETTSYPRIF